MKLAITERSVRVSVLVEHPKVCTNTRIHADAAVITPTVTITTKGAYVGLQSLFHHQLLSRTVPASSTFTLWRCCTATHFNFVFPSYRVPRNAPCASVSSSAFFASIHTAFRSVFVVNFRQLLNLPFQDFRHPRNWVFHGWCFLLLSTYFVSCWVRQTIHGSDLLPVIQLAYYIGYFCILPRYGEMNPLVILTNVSHQGMDQDYRQQHIRNILMGSMSNSLEQAHKA